MPVHLNMWRLGDHAKKLESRGLDREDRLESLLFQDISILSPDWMIIGRQVATSFGGIVDLLAIDQDGCLICVELKRDRTPRDVVAQLLDYATWVKRLSDKDIAEIFNAFIERYRSSESEKSLDEAFKKRFSINSMPDLLNESHKLVVVASALDESTERIVEYLGNDHGVPINAILFHAFRDDDREYLGRVWLIDPHIPQGAAVSVGRREEWNGEYYVSFGHEDGEHRHWDDARKYGFVSAGGGVWYSRTLSQLNDGDRIWVNVPGSGYVGVGHVVKTVVKADEFRVRLPDGNNSSLKEVELFAKDMLRAPNDPELAEYVVGVKWLESVPLEEAVRERGFFGNQNTVARPTTSKWQFTIERLKKLFHIID